MTDAGTAEHEIVAHAIGASGLTVAEVADRAGLDPVHLGHFPLDRLPLAVLSRLADVVGVPLGRLLHRWGDDHPEDSGDSPAVGAYLAEFREGLSRDELAEALGWTLLQWSAPWPHSTAALHGGGMRLALRGDRIIVVGRLEGTELSSRLSLERLTAGEMDPKLARFLWAALAGILPERIKDREAYDAADRLGLIWGWQGRVRVSQPVEFSLYPATHRHCTGPLY